jgi:hypothetical protein
MGLRVTRLGFSVIVLAGLCACDGLAGGSRTQSAATAVVPPEPSDCPIEVYAGGLPARPYVVVGQLVATMTRPVGALEQDNAQYIAAVLPDLKAKACEAGADAIVSIVVRRGEGSLTVVSAHTVRFTTTK